MGETRLFIDWINIDKGGIHGTFDSERISDEGWRIIERNKKTWGLHADLSGHGMKSRRVPHGVRITIEKARKSGPWLQLDRPWEKKIHFITVIHEDGKYRGWYGVEFPRPREAGNGSANRIWTRTKRRTSAEPASAMPKAKTGCTGPSPSWASLNSRE